MGFRLVPKLMTSNVLEPQNGRYFAFGGYGASYVKVVEVKTHTVSNKN